MHRNRSSEDCGCATCDEAQRRAEYERTGSFSVLMNRFMILCPECGNKRCPHAADHRLICTGSNEPGQPGSNYPAIDPDAPRLTVSELERLLLEDDDA